MPKLLPLLGQENAAVREAAYQRARRHRQRGLGSRGGAPTGPPMTAHLMTLVRPDQPAAIKLLGLRLLPIVVPPDGDVGPLAALLDDPDLREKAARGARRDRHGAGRERPCEPPGQGGPRLRLCPARTRWAASTTATASKRSRRWLKTATRRSAPRPLALWPGRAIRPTSRPSSPSSPPPIRARGPTRIDALLRLLASMSRQPSTSAGRPGGLSRAPENRRARSRTRPWPDWAARRRLDHSGDPRRDPRCRASHPPRRHGCPAGHSRSRCHACPCRRLPELACPVRSRP